MKFHSLRKSLIGGVLATVTALLLGACGGGGGAADPLQGGQLSLLPGPTAGGVYYAGIPVNMAVAGGRKPYALFSSEPGILAVPNSLNGNTFTVVPNNPGVIDAGLGPDDLPVRTVILTVRDANALQTQVSVQVAQNFLTGYGISFTSNCPSTGQSGGGAAVCSGGESAVRFAAVFNGSLVGARQFRLEIVRGPASFVFPGTNNTGNTITTVSDHNGIVTGVLRVQAGVPTQVGVLRVVDVATGVYADHAFVIAQGQPTTDTITAIPNEFTLRGATDTECGTGSFDVFIYDAAAPVTAAPSDPNLRVTRVGGSGDQPQRFTITAFNPSWCMDPGVVVFTDATGAQTTVEVTTEVGDAPPDLPALAVAPLNITLTCGTAGSITVVGGTGRYQVNSTHPRVTSVVGGNTVTITRLTGDGATAYPTTASISVSDGIEVQTVTATVPANCP